MQVHASQCKFDLRKLASACSNGSQVGASLFEQHDEFLEPSLGRVMKTNKKRDVSLLRLYVLIFLKRKKREERGREEKRDYGSREEKKKAILIT